MTEFTTWFAAMTGHPPHPWQEELACATDCRDRLIRIPTGFGKTAGTVLAWLWNRMMKPKDAWPRRLAFCLPMRVLVEQTEAEVRRWLKAAGMLWDDVPATHDGKVGVHVLMGGIDAGDWHLNPEHPAILIGTQDMLLSRALNRGYGCGRARWPMEFGLLNQDCLWVVDEVQLMDVGLATSAQLQSFRAADAGSGYRPCATWWMSATLQSAWLRSVDTESLIDGLTTSADRILSIPATQRKGSLWQVTKHLRRTPAATIADVASLVVAGHAGIADGMHGRITLAIVNTVDRAVELHALIAKQKSVGTEVRLVHSRFRGAERAAWRSEFLAREHCRPGADRIIVATQVVEAGVDLSAGCLVTDLAPWPSLVQRFGRAARYGGSAMVIVAEQPLDEDAQVLPYARAELLAAREFAVGPLAEGKADVAQAVLEDFEAGLSSDVRSTLYPYTPDHLLLRHEWDELFDTTPDLSGADLDISRFIRNGDERDCQVFWVNLDEHYPDTELQPGRAALCPVSFLRVRDWLCGKGKDTLKKNCRAYVLDYLDGRWRPARSRDLYPGRVVLVDAAWGGYQIETGFTGAVSGKNDPPIPAVILPATTADQRADGAQDREDLSASCYQTIATHGREVGHHAKRLGQSLGLSEPLVHLLDLAGRWHDAGKAHPAFRGSIIAHDAPDRKDLAKAPSGAWASVSMLYNAGSALGRRVGFRHELASALAVLELLARRQPDHAALRGGLESLIGDDDAVGTTPMVMTHPLADELAALDASAIDLLLFLIVAHHGKVRAALHASPSDQTFPLAERLGYPLRGICDGDVLPVFPLSTISGMPSELPALRLRLDCARLGLSSRFGRSWRERTLALQRTHGPAALAWLETIVRTADVRASRAGSGDPLLNAAAHDGDRP
ncbi:MAG: DEAD/DEAH box helicase [Planctomycetes bacterium]|nr:DEAD/DEAH box helicase [Planctomycetota bacterium]